MQQGRPQSPHKSSRPQTTGAEENAPDPAEQERTVPAQHSSGQQDTTATDMLSEAMLTKYFGARDKRLFGLGVTGWLRNGIEIFIGRDSYIGDPFGHVRGNNDTTGIDFTDLHARIVEKIESYGREAAVNEAGRIIKKLNFDGRTLTDEQLVQLENIHGFNQRRSLQNTTVIITDDRGETITNAAGEAVNFNPYNDNALNNLDQQAFSQLFVNGGYRTMLGMFAAAGRNLPARPFNNLKLNAEQMEQLAAANGGTYSRLKVALQDTVVTLLNASGNEIQINGAPLNVNPFQPNVGEALQNMDQAAFNAMMGNPRNLNRLVAMYQNAGKYNLLQNLFDGREMTPEQLATAAAELDNPGRFLKNAEVHVEGLNDVNVNPYKKDALKKLSEAEKKKILSNRDGLEQIYQLYQEHGKPVPKVFTKDLIDQAMDNPVDTDGANSISLVNMDLRQFSKKEIKELVKKAEEEDITLNLEDAKLTTRQMRVLNAEAAEQDVKLQGVDKARVTFGRRDVDISGNTRIGEFFNRAIDALGHPIEAMRNVQDARNMAPSVSVQVARDARDRAQSAAHELATNAAERADRIKQGVEGVATNVAQRADGTFVGKAGTELKKTAQQPAATANEIRIQALNAVRRIQRLQNIAHSIEDRLSGNTNSAPEHPNTSESRDEVDRGRGGPRRS